MSSEILAVIDELSMYSTSGIEWKSVKLFFFPYANYILYKDGPLILQSKIDFNPKFLSFGSYKHILWFPRRCQKNVQCCHTDRLISSLKFGNTDNSLSNMPCWILVCVLKKKKPLSTLFLNEIWIKMRQIWSNQLE